MSSEERKLVDEYLKNNQKLPEGYALKTRITEGKIVPSAIASDDEATRENVEVQELKLMSSGKDLACRLGLE